MLYIKRPIPIEAIRYEGDMLCPVGSYVVKGVDGEFYPCRGDIFEKTYVKYE